MEARTLLGNKSTIAVIILLGLVGLEALGFSNTLKICYSVVASSAFLANGLSSLGWNIDLPGKSSR